MVLKRLKQIESHEINSFTTPPTASDTSVEESVGSESFEEMLANKFGCADYSYRSADSLCTADNFVIQKLESEINAYEFRFPKTLSVKGKVLQVWMGLAQKFPVLKCVVDVIMAAPATQVSVERAFSTLKFLLSDLRTSLSDQKTIRTEPIWTGTIRTGTIGTKKFGPTSI